MMKRNHESHVTRRQTGRLFAVLAALVVAPQVHAYSPILNNFNSTYPGSSSGDNAGCNLCHGSSTNTWNQYGWGLRSNGRNFSALEAEPSINVNGGTTMLDEINAGTQPGWTAGANNNLYNSGGLISSSQSPPPGIGALDPTADNQSPTADTGGPYEGIVGVAVDFDAGASTDPDGSIATYEWDFGDGGTDTGVSTSHTYASDGVFTIGLTVTDNNGAQDSATTTATITLPTPLPPVASHGGPYVGTAGVAVQFDGSASSDPDGGSIVSYAWDFGDGSLGSGATPTHAYANAGTYGVSLTVTDDEGASDTATTSATIAEPSPLDLDIKQLRVSKSARAGKSPVRVLLAVTNGAPTDGQAQAVITGVQNGTVVYSQAMMVSDSIGGGATTWVFPGYTPTGSGDIVWTATVADGDPDVDEATATTRVR